MFVIRGHCLHLFIPKWASDQHYATANTCTIWLPLFQAVLPRFEPWAYQGSREVPDDKRDEVCSQPRFELIRRSLFRNGLQNVVNQSVVQAGPELRLSTWSRGKHIHTEIRALLHTVWGIGLAVLAGHTISLIYIHDLHTYQTRVVTVY